MKHKRKEELDEQKELELKKSELEEIRQQLNDLQKENNKDVLASAG